MPSFQIFTDGLRIHLHLGSISGIWSFHIPSLFHRNLSTVTQVTGPHTILGREPRTLREAKGLAVSDTAIALGNGFEFWKQPKAIWSKVYSTS